MHICSPKRAMALAHTIPVGTDENCADKALAIISRLLVSPLACTMFRNHPEDTTATVTTNKMCPHLQQNCMITFIDSSSQDILRDILFSPAIWK